MGYWSGKVVLVTGSSAGLGYSIAKAFVSQNAKVVVTGRDEDRLQEAAARLQEYSEFVHPIVADIMDDDQVEQLIQSTVGHFGKLDVLVNNVGKSARSKVLNTSPADFEELMETNFLSLVRCTRAAWPHLESAKGHVVNIGSLSSKTVSPFLSAYAASKFAVAAYSQQLRLESSTDVNVLLVCPGPIARADAGDRYDDQAKGLPESAKKPGGGARLRRFDPDKLAKLILNAAQRRKVELVLPRRARILFAVAQLWPTLGDWIVKRYT